MEKKDKQKDDPGKVIVGSYVPYPLLKRGKVIVGYYGATPPTPTGQVIIGKYESWESICNPNIII